MKTEIKKWGNSAAIRIPSKMLAQLNLDISSAVSINVTAGKLEVSPTKQASNRIKLPFSESDLLENLDSYTAHSDELIAPQANEVGI